VNQWRNNLLTGLQDKIRNRRGRNDAQWKTLNGSLIWSYYPLRPFAGVAVVISNRRGRSGNLL
jgi:hypothetical protein